MKKIKAGIIGLGFMGFAHADAIRRAGFAELAAVCDISADKAKELSVGKYYTDYDDLIDDPEIDVIHNCAPNNIHYEINKKAIKANKHIFSEKPLSLSQDESLKLISLLQKHPVHNAVNFQYRMFPNVMKMKRVIESGEIGKTHIVHGRYLQDWLLYETDYNWRIEPEYSGPTRVIADIGSHWCDLAQSVINSKIVELFADLVIVLPVRKKPNNSGEYEDKKITTEDFATVMLKFENGTRGVFYVSQMSAGRKNFLEIEINGSSGSVAWNQEDCDKLWMGFRNKDNVFALRRQGDFSVLPDGHPEGWADGLKNNLQSFYNDIINDKYEGGYATFKDGHNIMIIIDAILESARSREWKKVKQV